MVYQMEKMLRDSGDKISGTERGEVENAIADAKKALESGDKATMDKAREHLTQASHKLAEQMYKAAGTQGAPGAGPTAGAGPAEGGNGQAKKDEGVIDAEYVDVEDKK
jgi:molecular chaperone DnaK